MHLSALIKMSIVSPSCAGSLRPQAERVKAALQGSHKIKEHVSHARCCQRSATIGKCLYLGQNRLPTIEVARDATWQSDVRISVHDAKRTFLLPIGLASTYLLNLPSPLPKRCYFRSPKREHRSSIRERNHSALKDSEPPYKAPTKHETCASNNSGAGPLQSGANVAIPGGSSSDRVMWR